MNEAAAVLAVYGMALAALCLSPSVRGWFGALWDAIGVGPRGVSAEPVSLEELHERHAALLALTPTDTAWAAGHGLDVPAELLRLRAAARDRFSNLRPELYPAWTREPAVPRPAVGPTHQPDAVERFTAALERGPVQLVRMADGTWGTQPTEPPRLILDAPWMGVHAKLIPNPAWTHWAREHAPHRLPARDC